MNGPKGAYRLEAGPSVYFREVLCIPWLESLTTEYTKKARKTPSVPLVVEMLLEEQYRFAIRPHTWGGSDMSD